MQGSQQFDNQDINVHYIAKQPQFPQPLLISLLLQTLHQLRCPSLDSLQHLNVSLVVRGPKRNTGFEVRPQTKQPQFPQPLLIRLLLQTLHQLHCPSLDTVQHLNVSLIVRGPKRNTVFEGTAHAHHRRIATSVTVIAGSKGGCMIKAHLHTHKGTQRHNDWWGSPAGCSQAHCRKTISPSKAHLYKPTEQRHNSRWGTQIKDSEGGTPCLGPSQQSLSPIVQVSILLSQRGEQDEVIAAVCVRAQLQTRILYLLLPQWLKGMGNGGCAWGPSHGRQSSMNFSNMSPSHRLHCFKNCSSVGPFHRVQSFRNRLLQCGSPTGSQVLPANLLQRGVLSPQVHRSCQEPAPAWASHRVTASFRHIHLLWCGVLHRLRVDICSTINLHGLQGDSLPRCPNVSSLGTVFTTGCRGLSAAVRRTVCNDQSVLVFPDQLSPATGSLTQGMSKNFIPAYCPYVETGAQAGWGKAGERESPLPRQTQQQGAWETAPGKRIDTVLLNILTNDLDDRREHTLSKCADTTKLGGVADTPKGLVAI
ncbi:hypothetical protein QYF61_016049 [Mycteria americana]|uniref:Uncharacterized protein n=1 Tax=Mycteria americana TaxID=33587 RepID=A0AAN7S8M2_MYCAM|nr:hypothetical protein QYF61_016049 [Mycteria americana]